MTCFISTSLYRLAHVELILKRICQCSHNAVIGSWQLAFNWEQNVDFEIRDVKARVMTDSAWVTMKAYLNMGSGNVTNVFELHNGRWYMVHHHCSVMLIHGGAGQQAVQG